MKIGRPIIIRIEQPLAGILRKIHAKRKKVYKIDHDVRQAIKEHLCNLPDRWEDELNTER